MPPPKNAFGNLAPWSEPAWYSSLASPYYNETHKQLRDEIRAYTEKNVLPYSLEWDEKGDAPRAERLKYARSGFAFADVPTKYRPADVPGLAGIPVADLDIFHLLVMTDETSRVEGGVMTALLELL